MERGIEKKNIRWILILIGSCIISFMDAQEQRPLKWKLGEGDEKQTLFNIPKTVPNDFRLIDGDASALKIGKSWWRKSEMDNWIKDTAYGVICYLPLQSDDKQCELWCEYIGTNAKWEEYRNSLGDYDPDQAHRNHIVSDLMCLLDTSDFRFDDYVTVLSGHGAKERYNADSILFFTLPIAPIEENEAVYTDFIRMYIVRKGRVSMRYTWAFTAEAAKKKQEYMDRLNKHIWFTEEEEE